jgi:hypothetical protein
MDLEKPYDRVDMMAMRKVLRMYGVGRNILSAINIMDEEGMVCVRIGRMPGRKFKVGVWLCQGCGISPLLFNVFIEGVVREVNGRVIGG